MVVRQYQQDWRITLNFGFHRRVVLGLMARRAQRGGGVRRERIRERARLIGYGIDARRSDFGGNTVIYAPHARPRHYAGRRRKKPQSRTTTARFEYLTATHTSRVSGFNRVMAGPRVKRRGQAPAATHDFELFTVSGIDGTTCHCEARSDEAISC